MASSLCQATLPRPGTKRRFAVFSPGDLQEKRNNVIPLNTKKVCMYLKYDKFVIRFGFRDVQCISSLGICIGSRPTASPDTDSLTRYTLYITQPHLITNSIRDKVGMYLLCPRSCTRRAYRRADTRCRSKSYDRLLTILSMDQPSTKAVIPR